MKEHLPQVITDEVITCVIIVLILEICISSTSQKAVTSTILVNVGAEVVQSV
jgi:hypothetical protein